MFTADIGNKLLAQRMIPAIICTADASHYLIGAEDARGNFFNAFSPDSSRLLVASSLEQAKSVLRQKGLKKLWWNCRLLMMKWSGLSRNLLREVF